MADTNGTDWIQQIIDALTQVGVAWAQSQGTQATQQVAQQTQMLQQELAQQQKQTQMFMIVGLGVLAVVAYMIMKKE